MAEGVEREDGCRIREQNGGCASFLRHPSRTLPDFHIGYLS